MKDANKNLDVIDHDTEISILVNAIFFDLGILVAESLKRFPNYDNLPVEEIVNNLIIDKEISEKEARNLLDEFTRRYYGRG